MEGLDHTSMIGPTLGEEAGNAPMRVTPAARTAPARPREATHPEVRRLAPRWSCTGRRQVPARRAGPYLVPHEFPHSCLRVLVHSRCLALLVGSNVRHERRPQAGESLLEDVRSMERLGHWWKTARAWACARQGLISRTAPMLRVPQRVKALCRSATRHTCQA